MEAAAGWFINLVMKRWMYPIWCFNFPSGVWGEVIFLGRRRREKRVCYKEKKNCTVEDEQANFLGKVKMVGCLVSIKLPIKFMFLDLKWNKVTLSCGVPQQHSAAWMQS